MNRRDALQRTALIMGTALTPALGSAILNGCVPDIELNWSPRFLTNKQALIAGQMADRIIPATDTPGALDVHVDQFIDYMLEEVYSTEDGGAYRTGIEKINRISKKELGKDFFELTNDKKDMLLLAFDSEDERVFQITKELTLIGYFTSEEGMKSNFEYRPIPGEYKDCVPNNPGDKVWIGNHVFNI